MSSSGMPPSSGSPSSPSSSRGSVRPSPLAAASFIALGSEGRDLAPALVSARKTVPQPSGAIVFASGSWGEAGRATVEALRSELGDLPIVLASSTGVLTERAEHEGGAALSGIIWSGGSVTPLLVPAKTPNGRTGGVLVQQIAAALGDAGGTVVLMPQPHGFSQETLRELAPFAPHTTVIGGGTLPGGAWLAAPGEKVIAGDVVGLVLRGIVRPAVRASSACRLLAPFAPVTEARGAMVLRLGHEAALDVLSAGARDLSGRPLVLAVIAESAEHQGHPEFLVRGIRGVDPARKAVVVTDEATPGRFMTFAVCDARASRAELTLAVRDLARQMAGAAPQFGLLFTCAGRGSRLYGERDVETRIVRERFPNVPFAGMFSSFEIGSLGGRPAMHLYTGVVTMFGAPS